MRVGVKESITSMPRRGVHNLGRILSITIATACLLSLAASASAEIPFCTFGSGQGQCNSPEGIAVDRSTGDVYVADRVNNRINVFDEGGNFLRTFGTAGTGDGQLSNPRWVAVDNDPASPAFHDVYVTDTPSNGRVQKFSPSGEFILSFGTGDLSSGGPVAVGPGGTVLVAQDVSTGTEVIGHIETFAPSGVHLGTSALPGNEPDFGRVSGLGVDSFGDIYVIRVGGVEKFKPSEPDATFLYAVLEPNSNAKSIALDSNDNLLIAHVVQSFRVITEFNSAGTASKRFGYNQIERNLVGLAAGVGDNVFGSEEYGGAPQFGSKVTRITPPPPGPLTCCLESTIGNTKATLKGGLNPEGKETTYHFEYITQVQFEADGNSFGAGTIKTPESAAVGSDVTLYSAQAEVGCNEPSFPPQASCLEPETDYRYRLVAANQDGQSSTEGEFETKPGLEITATFATDVGPDAAELHATVNPLGVPATGYFEYVEDAKYQADLALGEGHDGFAEATKTPDVDAGRTPIDFGAGETGKTASVQVPALTPGTIYHYRVVVTDPFLSFMGPESSLTTFRLPTQPSNTCPNTEFRIGSAVNLPDCRAYEMVSPVDKNGGDVKVLLSALNSPTRLEWSSNDGDRFAFSSITSFPGSQSAPWTSEYLASRTAGESWATQAISPPRESTGLGEGLGKFDSQYKLFSPDLSSGWLVQEANPTLSDCAQEGLINLYRRDSVTGAYEALIPGDQPLSGTPDPFTFPELEGVSVDGTHSVFRFNARLTKDAASTNKTQLYEHVRGGDCGELHLVSVLPNGQAATGGATAGMIGNEAPNESRLGMVTHAVSEDGSRIYWRPTESSFPVSPLYVRVNADQEQSLISAGNCTEPAKACTVKVATGEVRLWGVSADGSKAIYSVEGTSDQSLYEFDLGKALAGETASTLIAEGSRSVVGVSRGASRVYFTSIRALGGEGEAGKPNLYLYEGGITRLVTTLFGGDARLPGGDLNDDVNLLGVSLGGTGLISRGARITPDGDHLAFVSAGNLTDYDNTDVVDGRPDLEVYLYSAETGELACVSCNPTGARPVGREVKGSNGTIRKVSAVMAPGENQFFAPRALSDSGSKLFFESFEALLPADTNGKADVYEWQAGESQSACEGFGAALYVSNSGGCLSLISTGQSPVDSELADASPDGSDVFIRTSSSLLPQDPGQVDIYDARENGGLPQPPAPPAACEGEACQGPLAPPNDPTPGSSTFQGAGNVVEKPIKRKKAHHRKHGKKPHKSKRTNHKGRAGR